jgi:tRNA threonylcarbamoyladenosine biosynthesis protein TsaB
MKVLGLDTATGMTGVAVVEDDRVLWEVRLGRSLAHEEHLLRLIDRSLSETGMSLDRIDGVSLTIGPGMFTGIRIAVGTIKGLLSGSPLPVVPVSTLEALAWNLPLAREPVCPMLDAKKGEVYAALFRFGESGEIKRLADDRVASVENFPQGTGEAILFLGEGARLHRDRLERRLGRSARFAPPTLSDCMPSVVARLGMERLKKGEGIGCDRLDPVYLRRSDAEVNREKRRRETARG